MQDSTRTRRRIENETDRQAEKDTNTRLVHKQGICVSEQRCWLVSTWRTYCERQHLARFRFARRRVRGARIYDVSVVL